MESSGERVASIPPVERHQVLRPGIRIVAEQFHNDPEPNIDELSFADALSAIGGSSWGYLPPPHSSHHWHFDVKPFEPPVPPVTKVRKDRKPKGSTDHEPRYVSLTKRKRR